MGRGAHRSPASGPLVSASPLKSFRIRTHRTLAGVFSSATLMHLSRIVSSIDPSVPYQWYRCQGVFDALVAWLRAKGVQGQKPFHQLRKLYGSALSARHGIHAAPIGLRHSDIRTTTEHYADSRIRLTPGFGAVLSGADVSAWPGIPTTPHSPDRSARAVP
jgi:hypothetical protein